MGLSVSGEKHAWKWWKLSSNFLDVYVRKMLVININFLQLGVTNERPAKEMLITEKHI